MDLISWLRTPLGGRRRGRSCDNRQRSVSSDITETHSAYQHTPAYTLPLDTSNPTSTREDATLESNERDLNTHCILHSSASNSTQLESPNSECCDDHTAHSKPSTNKRQCVCDDACTNAITTDPSADYKVDSLQEQAYCSGKTSLLTHSLSLFQLGDDDSDTPLCHKKPANNTVQMYAPTHTDSGIQTHLHAPSGHPCTEIGAEIGYDSIVRVSEDQVTTTAVESLKTTRPPLGILSVSSAPDLNKRMRDAVYHTKTCDMKKVTSTYAIVKALATGSRTGRVCLARHRESGKPVVWKEQAITERDRMYVHNEAQIHSFCEHPHIARVFHVANTPQSLTLVMEYLGGGELFSHIKPKAGLEDRGLIREYTVQLASAVGYLHEMGIAHRDIKPENIVCTTDGRSVKLVDFGLSEYVYVDSTSGNRTAVSNDLVEDGRAEGIECLNPSQQVNQPSRTNGGTISSGYTISGYPRDQANTNMIAGVRYRLNVGTTNFMAPELVRNTDGEFGSVDLKACDVWALGVCLFCMCTGRFPWAEATSKCVGYRCYSAGEHTTQDLWMRIPAPALTLLSHMLAIDVSERWTIKEVQNYLQTEWVPAKVVNHNPRSRASAKKPHLTKKSTVAPTGNNTESTSHSLKYNLIPAQQAVYQESDDRDSEHVCASSASPANRPVHNEEASKVSATGVKTPTQRPITPSIITTSYCSPPTQRSGTRLSDRTPDSPEQANRTQKHAQNTCLSTSAAQFSVYEKSRPNTRKVKAYKNKVKEGRGKMYLEVPIVSFSLSNDDSGFESEEYSRQMSAETEG